MEAPRDSKQAAEEELAKLKLNQGEEHVVEECKTPTRSRNKIPSIQTFPPAPRKKRTFSLLMTRSSASDLSLFVRDEEVEPFFLSMFELARVHKRCRSI
ncbi:hypothetical protein Lal_00028730 [Lupinus albus]|uniref:Uncharacterized protein n=1 Tax=Lupinus albus TaxID=3870 RepID=A0A6A4NV03_LUPAL|nr:hypothetical protein Lalb_Chr19g0136841 [Lupinus albus]KAF1884843.1 hypothetical protein Lal_00028730 [Lupinus albus]